MSKAPLEKHDLITSPATDRFLQELSDHAADSGNPHELGSKQEIITAFNTYLRAKLIRRLVIVAGVAGFTAVAEFFYWWLAGLFQSSPDGPSLLLLGPGLLLYAPVTVITIPLMTIMSVVFHVNADAALLLVRVLSAPLVVVFWTSLSFVLLIRVRDLRLLFK